jgi:hypothetical protein
VKKGGQRGSAAACRRLAAARTSAGMRCRTHAAPVAPVHLGRALARALWSTIRSMAHTGVLRGPRGGSRARWSGLVLREERASKRACPCPAWLGLAMCGSPPGLLFGLLEREETSGQGRVECAFSVRPTLRKLVFYICSIFANCKL